MNCRRAPAADSPAGLHNGAHELRGRPARGRLHRQTAGLAAGDLPRGPRPRARGGPEVVETIKRTVQPYFVLQGNVCALLAAKTHVNVFLYDGAIVPDPEGIITGGHDNKTARAVAIRRGEPINKPALLAMLRQIIANNRAGGWRKLKRESGEIQ